MIPRHFLKLAERTKANHVELTPSEREVELMWFRGGNTLSYAACRLDIGKCADDMPHTETTLLNFLRSNGFNV